MHGFVLIARASEKITYEINFAIILVCNSVGVQCFGNGNVTCVDDTDFCDGDIDCTATGIDEGPLFCGELIECACSFAACPCIYSYSISQHFSIDIACKCPYI